MNRFSPKIVDFIFHHLSRQREALQAFELLHLLLALNVAALTEQNVLLRHFSRPARQVVFEGRHYALPYERNSSDSTMQVIFVM